MSTALDPSDVRRAREAPGLLRAFNDAGVLVAADVHVARRLGRLGGDEDDHVLLAAAIAVRGPRLGHVCADLSAVRSSAAVDADVPVDVAALPWPEPGEWAARLAASPLVAVGDHGPADRPLRLVGTLLYLDRYWREERRVAAELAARAADPAEAVDIPLLRAGLDRLFADPAPDHPRLAAASAVLRRLAVVVGGPGTGKTTTVARILALLDEQAAAAGAPPPLVALTAPTGKAAARLEEAVREQAALLDVDAATRARLAAAGATTLHRLLGWRPGGSRYVHHRGNRLPHDVVVVDETSMVPLSLMARLVEAVRAGARLVLVGDPQQLASVEAGAVLGDIVGPAADGLLMRAPAREALAAAAGQDVPAGDPPAGAVVGDGLVVLRRVHRFGGGIAALAEAVRRGDADAALAVLRDGAEGVAWMPEDAAAAGEEALAPVRTRVVAAGRAVVEAARTGAGAEAIAALAGFRLLCAHRRGPHGVAAWSARAEAWIGAGVPGFAAEGAWYVGRPLMVTENDYGLRLYNGDTGVVVAAAPGRVAAAFARAGGVVAISPSRLGPVETVHAMTVHKSQGSQFDAVAVVLPDPGSPVLTRELLYTAVTRARTSLTVVGTEASLRAAVARPVARASGLRARLWGG